MEILMHRVFVASLVVSGFGVAHTMSAVVSGTPPVAPDPARGGEPPRSIGAEVDLGALDAVPEDSWKRLREARIFFAHQSVGSNILRGLERIEKRRPAFVPSISAFAGGPESPRQRATRPAAGLFHAPAGKNGDPLAKVAEFERVLLTSHEGPDSDDGSQFELALLKLCYADIGRATDVKALFSAYCSAVERIERARPSLRVIHCTVPLRTAGQGAKAAVKRLVGAGTAEANAARGRFNDMMRARFPAERIFDIAHAESRCPDGSQASDAAGGARWPALCEAYSRDGGHLNELGQEVLARELLLSLVRSVSDKLPAQRKQDSTPEAASKP
jgi:hypothetical protein